MELMKIKLMRLCADVQFSEYPSLVEEQEK